MPGKRTRVEEWLSRAQVPLGAAVPGAARAPTPAPHEVVQRLAHDRAATIARLESLQASARAAHAAAGGATRGLGAFAPKQPHGHGAAAHAAARHHLARAEAHRAASRDEAAGPAPAAPAAAHAPLRFKEVANPAAYLPAEAQHLDKRKKQQVVALVQRKIEHDRRAAQHSLGTLHTAQQKDARAIRKLRPTLVRQISRAQQRALARVSSAEPRATAAAAGAFAAAQGQVHGAAAQARGRVEASHKTTIAELHTAETTAIQKLAHAATEATNRIKVAEHAQTARVIADYAAAHAQVDAGCATVAGQARGLGDSVPLPYSGAKLAAARAAARATAASWAGEVPGEMQRDAQSEIFSHEPASKATVDHQAETGRLHVEAHHKERAAAIRAAHQRARTAVDAARSQALSQIDGIAASASGSLSAQSAAAVAAIHHQAAAARAEIAKTGRQARKRIKAACARALLQLQTESPGLAQRACEIEVPDPEHTQRAVRSELARRKTASHSILATLEHEAHHVEHHLATEGAGAASAITAAGSSAGASAGGTAQAAGQSMSGVAGGAVPAMRGPGQHFAMEATRTVDQGHAQFEGLAAALEAQYRQSATELQTTIHREVTEVEQRSSQRIASQEPPAILAAAARAAAAVHDGPGAFSFLHELLGGAGVALHFLGGLGTALGTAALGGLQAALGSGLVGVGLGALLAALTGGKGLLVGVLGIAGAGLAALTGGLSAAVGLANAATQAAAVLLGRDANKLYVGAHRAGTAIVRAEAKGIDKLSRTVSGWISKFRNAAEGAERGSLGGWVRDFASRFAMNAIPGGLASLLLNPGAMPYTWQALAGIGFFSLATITRFTNFVAGKIKGVARRVARPITRRVVPKLPGEKGHTPGRHRKT